MEQLNTIADPTDLPLQVYREPRREPPTLADQLGLPPWDPGQKWLYEHRRNIDTPPYVALDTKGTLRLREGLEVLYPGLAPMIEKGKEAGLSDETISWAITHKVNQALEAGISGDAIEDTLYGDPLNLGMVRGAKEYMARVLLPQRLMDYTSWGTKERQYETTIEKVRDEAERGKIDSYYVNQKETLVNEMAAVTSRFFGAITLGIGPAIAKRLAGEEMPQPTTTAGAIAGAGADLGGFLLGPYKAASWVWGSRAAATATGLRGAAEIMAHGGATLATASMLSDIVPALEESPTLSNAAWRVAQSTTTGGIAGSLFPLAGAVENKALRVAVGLAVADKLKAGANEWFTVDDVAKGIADGSMDKGELAERTFGYLLDLYFVAKVPSMRKQLELRGRNAMVEEVLKTNPAEAEQFIVAMGKAGLVPGVKPQDLQGLSAYDVQRQFGGPEGFRRAFQSLSPKQVEAAAEAIKTAKAVPAGEMLPPQTGALQSKLQPLADAMLVEQSFNRSNAILAALAKGDLKAVQREIARLGWDASANVKRALLDAGGDQGKEAVIRKDLIFGAPEQAWYLYSRAAKDIYGGLGKEDHILLDKLIQARRNVAIGKYKPDFVFTDGLTAKQHQSYLDMRMGLTPERFADLTARADKYFQVMQESLTALKTEGLLTQEQYEGLVSKGDYERRNIIDYMDPEQSYRIGGKKVTVRDSGIQTLSDTGSTKVAETNSMLLMQEVIARTQARIMRNRANRALYDLAVSQPENGVVTPSKGEVPNGFEKITAMVDGKLKEMRMPTDLAAEWVTSDPMVTQQWKSIVGWAFGGNILKPMATGYNPFFAMTNMTRDIVHAWTVTTEKGWSSHLPIAAGQMTRDYLAVMPDVFARRGRYADYVMEGGGMGFLSHQGRMRQGAAPETVWGALERLAGWAGETSELWTRLALRERAIRNGQQPYQATWTARNYLDFNQGGSFTKSMDAAIPYLNAGVQGTRGIFRAAADDPVRTGWKFTQLGLLATGLYLYNREDPEFYNGVSARDKATGLNFRAPLPPFVDTDGTKKYYYVHIPLDQGQQVVSRLMEAITQKVLGDPVDIGSVMAATEDFSSISIAQVTPPALDAMVNLMGNYDFWMMDKVWRGPDVKPWREFGPRTSPAAVAVGKATNLSPERLQQAAKAFATHDNPFAEIAGWGLNQIFDKLPEQERQIAHDEALRQLPGIKRFLRVTDSFNEYRKANEEIGQEIATERYTRSMQLDSIADRVVNGQATQAEAMQYIAQQPVDDRQRLIQRLRRNIAWATVPDRRWWVDLSESPAEAAAAKYWYRWNNSTATEQALMEQTLFGLHDPKVATEKFMFKLSQLKGEK